MTLRIGILGAARIAPQAIINPARKVANVAVVAIAARDQAKARAFAIKHNIPQVHASYAALIADPTIDAIYNPLPNSLHAPWTIAALRAGKHVLCEKPLAANAAEAATVAKAAEESGLLVMEAFHNLYHPLAARMKAIVDSGQLGAINHVEAHFCTMILRRHDIRFDYGLAGGATMDLGCYTIRLLRYLLGSEPTIVRAEAVLLAPQIDRKMTVDLHFTRPAGGRITGVMTYAFWSPRLLRFSARVVGDAGELQVINPFLPHLFHRLRVKSAAGTSTTQVKGDSTYTHQLRAFVAAIQQHKTPLTDARDGVTNMQIIDEVYTKAGLRRRGEKM